jgi:putative transposase
VRWYHAKYDTTGRIWQGRFKAFPVQEDHHLLTVMRYVERNAQRSNLVERAEDWQWGSLAWRRMPRAPLALTRSPVSLPAYWRQYVNEPQTSVELAELRACVNRQRPFGEEAWVKRQIADLGLESSVTVTGRPRKSSRVPLS